MPSSGIVRCAVCAAQRLNGGGRADSGICVGGFLCFFLPCAAVVPRWSPCARSFSCYFVFSRRCPSLVVVWRCLFPSPSTGIWVLEAWRLAGPEPGRERRMYCSTLTGTHAPEHCGAPVPVFAQPCLCGCYCLSYGISCILLSLYLFSFLLCIPAIAADTLS